MLQSEVSGVRSEIIRSPLDLDNTSERIMLFLFLNSLSFSDRCQITINQHVSTVSHVC